MSKKWLKFILFSLGIHIALAGSMLFLERPMPPPKPKTVKITVTKTEPPKEKVKAPPKPKKPKPKKKIVRSERRPDKAPVKNAQPVQGVSAKSVTKGGSSSVAVPVGNTLMVEDKGIRLTPDKVESLEKDLSREAVKINDSVIKPEYTNDALDVSLEGVYRVEVYVDENGDVTDAELEGKIGYGMDRRVVLAARQVRFLPRLDKTGKAIAGWTVIVFNLKLN